LPPARGDNGRVVTDDEGGGADVSQPTFIGVGGACVVEQLAKLVQFGRFDAMVLSGQGWERSRWVKQGGWSQDLGHAAEARHDDLWICHLVWAQPGQSGPGQRDMGGARHDSGHRPVQGK
jgi:hypothetical protein